MMWCEYQRYQTWDRPDQTESQLCLKLISYYSLRFVYETHRSFIKSKRFSHYHAKTRFSDLSSIKINKHWKLQIVWATHPFNMGAQQSRAGKTLSKKVKKCWHFQLKQYAMLRFKYSQDTFINYWTQGSSNKNEDNSLSGGRDPSGGGYFIFSFKDSKIKIVNITPVQQKMITVIIKRHCQVSKEGWEHGRSQTYFFKITKIGNSSQTFKP